MIRTSEAKKTKRARARLWLIGLAATVSLAGGIFISDNSHASSGTPQKYSKDVPNNTNFVDVIIQPAGSWTSTLDLDIKSKGGSVKKTFKNFPARVVSMRGKDAITESTRTDVSFVSVARSTWPTGHITLTTGADQASAMAPTYGRTIKIARRGEPGLYGRSGC